MGLISRVSSRTYRGIFILNEHEGTRRSQRILNHRPKIAVRHGAKPQVVPTTDLRSRLRRRQVQVLEILVLLPEDQQEGRRDCRVRRGPRIPPRMREELRYLDQVRLQEYQREHVPRVPRHLAPTRRHPDVPRNGCQASSPTRFHPGPPNQTGQIQRVPTTTKQSHARPKHQIPTPTTSHVQESPARATILHQTTKHRLLNTGFQNVKILQKKLFAYLTSSCNNFLSLSKNNFLFLK